jgi:hypothetical protein
LVCNLRQIKGIWSIKYVQICIVSGYFTFADGEKDIRRFRRFAQILVGFGLDGGVWVVGLLVEKVLLRLRGWIHGGGKPHALHMLRVIFWAALAFAGLGGALAVTLLGLACGGWLFGL